MPISQIPRICSDSLRRKDIFRNGLILNDQEPIRSSESSSSTPNSSAVMVNLHEPLGKKKKQFPFSILCWGMRKLRCPLNELKTLERTFGAFFFFFF